MSFSVEQICAWTGGRLVNADRLGEKASEIRVGRPAPLGVSQSSELAYFFSREYEKEVMTARCGILITAEPFFLGMQKFGLPLLGQAAIIVCADPYMAMALLSEKFANELSSVAHVAGTSSGRQGAETQIHASAVVDASAKVATGAKIGAHCVIEAGARIGARTVLYPGCFVGPGVVIGEDCVLFPNVALYEWTQLGNRVRIHANSTLGSDGFGYAPQVDASKTVTGHQKIYHLGRVVVGDDVEMGANSCADRSTMGDTIIEKSAKIDNQVHLGHNARVEEGAIICGGTCLAGGAHIGRFAYVGGLTGVGNRVHVGEGAQVGALTMVTKDVPPKGTAVGNPQREHREHFRAHAALNKLVSDRKKS